MVKHNNVLPNQHFHKKWARRVKTWFQQPIQKKIRRDKRKEKAAAIAPRPSSGNLRPIVHCPTQKYNMKIKFGRGFTLEELKVAGIAPKFAQTVGISVDHRRTNRCEESLKTNVDRLKEYQSRLVVFPRQMKKVKKGDSDKAACSDATQVSEYMTLPKKESAVTFTKITDVMKEAKGYATLRAARAEKRMYGKRLKKKQEAEEDK